MVLGALGCINNADFEGEKKVNDNIELDVFIICQKLRLFIPSFPSFSLPDHTA